MPTAVSKVARNASHFSTPSGDARAALPIVPLRREDLPIDTVELARFMVGKYLVRDSDEGRIAGRLVEVEAYPLGDSTSHAFIGRRAWNASMFLARGHAYIRLTYGSAYMLNMSSEAEEVGAGVLFRAVEPLEGLAAMAHRRRGAPLRDLARGPGRLTQAYGIGQSFDGFDLCGGQGLWIGRLDAAAPDAMVQNGATREPDRTTSVTTRIGLSRETHRLLRFYETGSRFVSGPRKLLADGV
ncbi:Putative 3-methyladenine DNA glycosylase [Paraburkholderia caffeinitolerans]|uniref:Putative 3-methyladenine DNA glycosylase n=1 Tax=Paraburkholderia caffeinitolerans TaxID=1723730 RepID=A0A6J5GHU0_9BURK|nr:DNA-3-methyladenine glycosylase [Paraburkholderia caffeinitolerans]CAB3797224.1 Putative 3-methyladenine DNA glycosylase [Paraburkholderia caffeinitolerans]